jgi:hypothetical protein
MDGVESRGTGYQITVQPDQKSIISTIRHLKVHSLPGGFHRAWDVIELPEYPLQQDGIASTMLYECML